MDQRFLRHRDRWLGDLYLDGIWYEDLNGQRAWRISVSSHGIDRSYWVSCNSFRVVGGNAIQGGQGVMLIGHVDSELDPTLRERILEMIDSWEHEPKIERTSPFGARFQPNHAVSALGLGKRFFQLI